MLIKIKLNLYKNRINIKYVKIRFILIKMRLLFLFNCMLLVVSCKCTSNDDSNHLDRRGAKNTGKGKGGVQAPAPQVVPAPKKGKVSGGVNLPKPPRICGTSYCDSDMLTLNAVGNAYHVPDLLSLSSVVWSGNNVNGDVLTTTTGAGISRVKYGDFCSGAQKSIYFLGSFAPNIAAPSWVANIPAVDVDINGNLNAGFSYKLDVTQADLESMNSAATFCKTTCSGVTGCKYGSYGWEAGLWFCKLYATNICTDPTQVFWRMLSPLSIPVLTVGGPPSITLPGGGGCRVSDTVLSNTPFLFAGSLRISPLTAYTPTLSYLSQSPPVDGIVASIKCDAFDGPLTPGFPTYGTVWV